MAFPQNPTDGQITVLHGTDYQWSDAKNAWTRLGGTLYTNSVVYGNLLPGSAEVTADIGTPDLRFKSLYLSGNTIDLGGAVIKTDAGSGAVSIVAQPTTATPDPVGIVISQAGTINIIQSTGGNVTASAIGAIANASAVNSTTTLANLTVTGAANVTGRVITDTGFFWANGTNALSIESTYGNVQVAAYIPTDPTITGMQANIGAFETYANLTFGTSSYTDSNVATYIPTDPTIYGIQANVGAYQIATNANLGTATTRIQTIDANLGSATTNLQTLNANVGAYEIYANANVGSITTQVNLLDANLGSATTDVTTLFGNAATQAVSINTLNANIGAYETYGNSRLLSLQTQVTTLFSDVGVIESNLGSTTNTINLLQANLGGHETYANATFGSAATLNTLDANVGTYEIYANGRLGSLQSQVTTLFSDVGVIEANLGLVRVDLTNIVTTANANTASYLLHNDITIGGNLVVSGVTSTVNTEIVTATEYVTTIHATSVYAATVGNTGATLTGTLGTASQPNITHVGSLLSLDVLGDAAIGGNLAITGNIDISSGNITISNSGSFIGNSVTGYGALYAGIPTGYTVLPSTPLQIATNANTYSQLNMQNIANEASASSDFVVTADNGNDTQYYGDFGIASSTYLYPDLSAIGPNDIYLLGVGSSATGPYSSGAAGNVVISSSNGQIKLLSGGGDHTHVVATVADTAFFVNTATPSTSNVTGALQVAGGVGIGGDIHAQGNVYSVGTRVLTAHDLETITYIPTYFTMDPNSVTVPTVGVGTIYGDYKFGDVTSVQIFGDYNTTANTGFISVYDVSGQPGHIEYFGFTGITDFSRVVMNINYTANSGHVQDIDLYNYQTNSWDTFGVYSGSGSWQQFALGVIDSAPYISSGNVTLRNYHLSSGNTTHRTWIDYVALEQTITGGQGPRGATGSTGATGATGPAWSGGYVANTTVFGSNLVANSATASTSTTSGALVVDGGLGVSGSIYTGGIYSTGYFFANGDPLSTGGSSSTYGNTEVAAYLPLDPTIYGMQANVGAYEIYANTRIQTIDANLGTTTTAAQTLNANVGAYEIATNANLGTVTLSAQTLNANVGAYHTWANTRVQTIDANLGTTTTAAQTLNANVGAYQTATNSTLSTATTGLQTLNANVGSYQIATNANLGTATTNITTLFSNAAAQASLIAGITTTTVATSNVALYESVTDDTTTNATYYPQFAVASSGNTQSKVASTKLTFNPSTGTLTSTFFSGAFNGTVGATTAAAGAFTTLSATSTVSGAGFTTYLASPPAIGATANAAGQFSSLGIGTAASGVGGEIRATNNITAYYSSDARLKENVQVITNALDIVDAIGGKTFDWTDDYIKSKGGADGYFIQKADFGVIAQDVLAVFPLAVRKREDGTLAVDYSKLAALAFAAIAELRAEINELKKNK